MLCEILALDALEMILPCRCTRSRRVEVEVEEVEVAAYGSTFLESTSMCDPIKQ